MTTSWNKDWLETQKQYMEALMSMAKTGPQQVSPGAQFADWQKTQQQWWQNKLFEKSSDPLTMFSRFMQYGNSWQSLSQQFNDMLSALSATKDNDADWEQVLKEQIELVKKQMLDTRSSFDIQNWQATMQESVEQWQKLVGSFIPGADAGSSGSQVPDFYRNLEKLFAVPGAQKDNVLQEQMQAGMELWKEYQQNCQAYAEMLGNIDLGSLDKLQEKILELAKKDSSISSLRELFDLWVDAHEETYSRIANTEEYSKLYGELINSMLKFREHSQQFMSEASSLFGMGTKEEKSESLAELEALKQQREKDKKRIRSLQEKIRKLEKDATTRTSSAKGKKKKAKKKTAKKKSSKKKK